MKILKIYNLLNKVLFFIFILLVQSFKTYSVTPFEEFSVEHPLSRWPKLSSISSDSDKIFYDSLWNSNKTLQENQKQLVDLFLETCCDFSFQKTYSDIRGIYFGKLQTGEQLVFTDEHILFRKKPGSEEILLYCDYYAQNPKNFNVPISTSIFPETTPLDLQYWMKQEFKNQLMNIASDSVGCEALRLAICRYHNDKNKPSKITFIPIKTDNKTDLSCFTGSNIWEYDKSGSNKISFKENAKEKKFILFNPNWFQINLESFLLKTKNKPFGTNEEFLVFQGILPKEAILLHQIIYVLNLKPDTNIDDTELIQDRSSCNYFYINPDEIRNFLIPGEQFNVLLFQNDITYETMYGLTKEGINPINESAYLAHKYNFIRPTCLGTNTPLCINRKMLSVSKSLKLLKSILTKHGDQDTYRYYLSNESRIQYPEFGLNGYICSDLNLQAQNIPNHLELKKEQDNLTSQFYRRRILPCTRYKCQNLHSSINLEI